MESWFDPTHDKVQILWIRSLHTPIHSLSMNLLREICEYLGHLFVYVPAIHRNQYRIYNVQKRTVREGSLEVSFTDGAVFCFEERMRLIVVGGWPAVRTASRIQDWKVTQCSSMKYERGWPGIFHWKHQTYVFGGGNPSIRACEKMRNDAWEELPSMEYERYSFNPCLYLSELLLPDIYQQHKVMESFSLIEEQFRVFPYTLPSDDSSNSMAYMTENNELVVISTSYFHYIWSPGRQQYAKHSQQQSGDIRAYSPCPLLPYKNHVYFSNFERAQLGCFFLESEELQEVKDFTVVS